jgi:hypothetical protein
MVSNWRVQGVDACQAGWIGIVLSQGTVSAYVAKESVISSKTPAERVFQALASEEIITWWARPGVFDTREWSGEVRVGGH